MNAIRELRAAIARNDITKKELAAALGIDRRTLSRSLHGKRDLKLSEFLALSEALDIEPSTLLTTERDNEKPATAATVAGE